jgi:hypothetical protein
MKVNKLYIALLLALLCVSCSDIYENIKDFSPQERIYPAKFDTISWKFGYERVEFDLCSQGRIPASQMKLGKAKKTIVEYDDKRIVIDSVCSWLSISGLTEARVYDFKIYTEDQYGNHSTPIEAALTPFTADDVATLSLTPPSVVESTTAAVIEWRNPIQSDMYSFYRYSYEYTDRDGDTHSGGDNGNLPSFFVENINKGTDVPVKITSRILPKMNGVPIIDSINWETTYTLHISQSAVPAIFLKTPVTSYTLDAGETDFPLEFAWIPVDEVTDYVLKVSRNANFSDDATMKIDVGTGNSYHLTQDVASSLIASFNRSDPFQIYWTIAPKTSSADIRLQTRNMTAIRSTNIASWWTFDDPANLFAAKNGVALEAVETGGAITSVAGPTATDRAIRIPKGSYLRCKHGILPLGSDKINTYSVAFDVKIPETGKMYSLLSTRNGYGTPTEAADISINNDGKIGVAAMGFSGFRTNAGRWTRIVLVADLTNNFYVYYADGLRIREGSISGGADGRFSLLPEGCLLFADNNGQDNELDVANIQFFGLKLSEYEIRKLGGVTIREFEKTGWSVPSFSSLNDGNVSYIIDNDPLTFAADWNSSTTRVKYYNIDMTKEQEIHAIAFHGRLYETWYTEMRHVDVFAGNDNSTWTKIITHDFDHYEATWLIALIDLPTPVTARYIRVEINYGIAYATFGGIYVYGKK